jgi:hypothetical protein
MPEAEGMARKVRGGTLSAPAAQAQRAGRRYCVTGALQMGASRTSSATTGIAGRSVVERSHLDSATGYITPRDMLAGRQLEIHVERDRKLEAARKQRLIRRQQAA